jgi:hypothetical protein
MLAGDRYPDLTRSQIMATTHITTDDSTRAMPVACGLTSADLAAQAGRWEQLAARAMTGRAETAHGLRISFRAEDGAEDELCKLVAVENDCCGWADWTVRTGGGQLVLDVRSTGDGIAALQSMFTGLQPTKTIHRDSSTR